MSRLVEFPLQDGGTVLVQVDEAAAEPATRGLGDRRLVTERAQQTFEQAIARVQPAAQALISRLRALADAPDEVRVEFTLPFEPLELENFLLRIGRPRRVVRSVDAPETTAIKVFGGQLYHALFHDDVRVSLERSPQRNRRQ